MTEVDRPPLETRQAATTREFAHPPGAEHHRDIQGGAARAAVFGISDGLLTNVALILGVAGASVHGSFVRLAGLAGLFAGAFSMAAGEYISMSAQSELLHRELDVERKAHSANPDTELRELASIYETRGLDAEAAHRLAETIMSNPELALEVHAREELGLNPEQTGSPMLASASSFVSFAVGAAIPLAPWFFAEGSAAIAMSIVLGVVTALGIGWALGIFTGRSRVRSALRQLILAATVAAVTYAIGALVGIHGAA